MLLCFSIWETSRSGTTIAARSPRSRKRGLGGSGSRSSGLRLGRLWLGLGLWLGRWPGHAGSSRRQPTLRGLAPFCGPSATAFKTLLVSREGGLDELQALRGVLERVQTFFREPGAQFRSLAGGQLDRHTREGVVKRIVDDGLGLGLVEVVAGGLALQNGLRWELFSKMTASGASS